MTRLAKEFFDLFHRAGYATRVDNSREGMVDLINGGFEHCSDGRRFANFYSAMGLGPKVWGGTLGKANMIGASKQEITDSDDLEAAIEHTYTAGFTPSFHNVTHDHIGCAEQVKTASGVLMLSKQVYTPNAGADFVVSRGGIGVELVGKHKETELVINLVEGMTRIPDEDNQKFWLDVPNLLDLVSPMVMVEFTTELLDSIRDVVDIRDVVINE